MSTPKIISENVNDEDIILQYKELSDHDIISYDEKNEFNCNSCCTQDKFDETNMDCIKCAVQSLKKNYKPDGSIRDKVNVDCIIDKNYKNFQNYVNYVQTNSDLLDRQELLQNKSQPQVQIDCSQKANAYGGAEITHTILNLQCGDKHKLKLINIGDDTIPTPTPFNFNMILKFIPILIILLIIFFIFFY